MSTCDMIQPPKMSPFWFASAGIGMTRSAGCFPSGSLSTGFQVMKRAPAERGETGAEDETGVGKVGIGDYALGHGSARFLEVRRDQLVDERGVVGIGLAFHGLALPITVKPLAGLLAEMPELHLVREDF